VVAQVKKLAQLKKWLTVADAARHLGIHFGEDVSEADVLRLALDGHLTLSVYFVNHAWGWCGPSVPKQRLLNVNGEEWWSYSGGLAVGEDRAIVLGSETVELRGVWDLTMLGSERLDVEHRYQALTGGPAVNLEDLEGPILFRDDGMYCQVREHFSNNEFADSKTLREPYHHPSNFYPAAGLPSDSVLVVKTSALCDLEARVSEPDQRVEKPVEQRERTSLLAIIAALAQMAKVDVRKPSSAADAIESQMIEMGSRVSSRAIQNHLKLIPEALDRLSK
jgi:hypothetical protein